MNAKLNNEPKTEVKERADFLLEIGVEELPAKILCDLVSGLAFNVEKGLQNAELAYSKAEAYVSPRRLAVIIRDLAFRQEDRVIEKRGPALNASFNEDGSPTQACLGFAASCGVAVSDLQKHKTSAGAWILCRKMQVGSDVNKLMPNIVIDALQELNLPKAMHWDNLDYLFIRPVRWVVMLYGQEVIVGDIFGVPAGRITYGHRFHHPEPIEIPSANQYVELLAKKGHVLVDFEQRKETIREQLAEITSARGTVVIDDDLLNEVTGLVEWPVAILCDFNPKFLEMPREILISVMKNHQRYFYLVEASGNLLPHFVVVSNIESNDKLRVVRGNERVMRARLNDMEFFHHADLKHPLSYYVENLKEVVYQDRLGTLYDKVLRLEKLAALIAEQIGADINLTKRAAFLAKADLVTSIVKEVPELQGVIGYYYALDEKEPIEVARAISEHYLPRYSGDSLPSDLVGAAVALADRIDHVVGVFGMGNVPTGDKDPYGLRRAALGIIRIIIENQLSLDLKEILVEASKNYHCAFKQNLTGDILDFIYERLRGWYLEQEIPANVFQAVLAVTPTNLLDFQRRVTAVLFFQGMPQAAALIAANKRVNNILKKSGLQLQQKFDFALLKEDAERELASELNAAEKIIQPLYAEGFYTEALKVLAELKTAVDSFFDGVMVMVEDEALRNNRLALLIKLRNLFGYVADISLL